MELGVEEVGPLERKLRVEIPTADVDAAFEAVYHDLGRQAQLPGFRKGRVPRSVLERTFSAQARGEVLERLVRETLPRAVEQSELPVISEPRLEPEGQPAHGAPFAYEATVEIRPEVEAPDLDDLQVEAPPDPDTEPAGEAVERYLEELRQSQAQLVEEPADTLAARGHVLSIDYEATVEGEPFEGGSGREAQVELGSGRAVGGFEDQLEGMVVGSEREFDLELPEDYPQAPVAGKRAHFRVRLLELKHKELAELDDEFAKDASEHETLAELRADLERRVEEGREEERKGRLRAAVLERLVESNPFPVPPSLVERQLQLRMVRAAQSLEGRVPPEELRQMAERWREEWREAAEGEVRLRLLLPKIAEREEIEVSEEDLDARLQAEARASERSVSQLRREYKEKGLLDALRAQLLEERAVERVVERARVSPPADGEGA